MPDEKQAPKVGEAAIRTEGLVMDYRYHFWSPRKRALDGLDMEVRRGEIFGYLGANGAGKTSTIKILVGLQKATGGTAAVFGENVEKVSSRRHLGFQPENPYFYEYLTARESMDFYGSLCSLPRADRRRRTEELLDFVGLSKAADIRLGQYSKGMRQRLGLAQALIHEPELVILDEPMSGLDPVGRRQVREAILRIREQGLTVFFSSHILGDVEMICDRVGLLVGGKLQAVGKVSDLVETESKGFDLTVEGLSRERLVELVPEAERRIDGEKKRQQLRLATQEACDAAMRAVIEAGGRIHEARPHFESLEEYFMRTLGVGGEVESVSAHPGIGGRESE